MRLRRHLQGAAAPPAEGVDVIELLQRQDEEAMASSGALPGSMLRQKWLHVIQARRPVPAGLPTLCFPSSAPHACCCLRWDNACWIC